MAITDEQIDELLEATDAAIRYGTMETFAEYVTPQVVKQLIGRIRELEAERDRAMKVLNPSMPESGLEDACRQLAQAHLSEVGNVETLTAQLAEARKHRAEVERESGVWVVTETKAAVDGFRSQVVSRCREVAADHRSANSGMCGMEARDVINDLAEEIEAMENLNL